ncbi:tRNA pseudouridine(55) synthase TruB [Accumulibacter sp.]|uniref:tRNA pseudouridine(55) synthase TruB n=1 Tax=Accumulibacter sp. TaxID=2053492 RepID=UPI002626EABD|nr:tRNA pseudouridine(55) synthase TruB [Accumulibacter sp.]
MSDKKRWRQVDGVLLLDKPTGMTSNSALQAARRLFSAAKAGHTGTLDPLASGLLPLCFGEATKFSLDLLVADKTYEAEMLFGVQTDTGDADGVIVRRCPVDFGLAEVEAVLPRFRGPLEQIPPMYSALKRNGQPLYEMARRGVEVERAARAVTIHSLRVLGFSGHRCRLRLTCSKGTYVRTLAEDLAAALGCAAHLTALRRVAVGVLDVVEAVPLDQLAALSEDERGEWLRTPDTLLQSLPAIQLDSDAGHRFVHGNAFSAAAEAGKYRVYSEGRLLGIGDVDGSGRLQPRRVVAGSAPAP